MTPQSEAVELVINALCESAGISVTLEALPKEGGISAEITGAEPKGRSLDNKHERTEITVLFLCKNTDQQTAYETLCRIGNTLSLLGNATGNSVYISHAGVRSGAGLVAKEGDYYIYSLIAFIGIYF